MHLLHVALVSESWTSKNLLCVFQVYRYKLLDPDISNSARVSVWPTWDLEADVSKSTKPPLGDKSFGAVEFSLWKDTGEEFLLFSTGESSLSTSIENHRTHSHSWFRQRNLLLSCVK